MNIVDNAVIYARKSTEDKDRQVASISDQLQEDNKIIQQNSFTLAHDPFTEEKTGKVSGVRTAFYEMLKFIQEGNANIIVTWHANRLARNGSDGGRIIEMVDNGVISKIITPTTIYDKNNSYMLWIEFMASTKSSKDLSEAVKRRLKIKAEMGIRPGQAPLGYLNTPLELKGLRRVIEDPQRFPLMREWWELMLTGNYTIKETLDIMTAKGLRDRKLGKIGYAKAERIFRNIFYAGIFDYGGIRYQGSHKPVVKIREFMKVQSIIDKSGRHGRTETRLPYQGIMKCGECGSTITGEKHHRGHKVFWYYRCKKNHGVCNQPYMNADDMNFQIKEQIKNYELNPEFGEWMKGVLKRRNQIEFEIAKKEKEAISKQLIELDGKKEVSCKMRIDGLITEDQYKDKINSILTEEKLLKESLSFNRGSYWSDVLERSIEFTEKMMKLFKTRDVFIRQQILKILGRTICIKDKKVYIQAKSVFMGLKKVEESYFQKKGAVEQQIVPSIWLKEDSVTPQFYSVLRVNFRSNTQNTPNSTPDEAKSLLSQLYTFKSYLNTHKYNYV